MRLTPQKLQSTGTTEMTWGPLVKLCRFQDGTSVKCGLLTHKKAESLQWMIALLQTGDRDFGYWMRGNFKDGERKFSNLYDFYTVKERYRTFQPD